MGDYDELEGHDPVAEEAVDTKGSKKATKAEEPAEPETAKPSKSGS